MGNLPWDDYAHRVVPAVRQAISASTDSYTDLVQLWLSNQTCWGGTMDTATVQYFVGLLFIACLITTTTKLRVIKNLVWDFVGELLAMLTHTSSDPEPQASLPSPSANAQRLPQADNHNNTAYQDSKADRTVISHCEPTSKEKTKSPITIADTTAIGKTRIIAKSDKRPGQAPTSPLSQPVAFPISAWKKRWNNRSKVTESPPDAA
ncbi:MAG: hypothetical protein LQ346_005097 [Caloplaca aetnensis]|nr:MAG: hypothetical protein LQ346_005097 [Caloplaca aetnensis]